MEEQRKILCKEDEIDGYIYVCPYCHRYVCIGWPEKPIVRCYRCHGLVDTEHEEPKLYEGRVRFDGLQSFE